MINEKPLFETLETATDGAAPLVAMPRPSWDNLAAMRARSGVYGDVLRVGKKSRAKKANVRQLDVLKPELL